MAIETSPPKIRIVCATRVSRADFLQKTALGRSLSFYNSPFIELRIFEKNAAGLPYIYNQAINESNEQPAILVFIHDDVYLCDFYWAVHILNALQQFDVVGLAGNKRRVANQPSWAFIDDKFTWDTRDNLSGAVGHGSGFRPDNLSFYGSAYQEVKLLDGLMLICQSQTLHSKNLRFDERFDFHFYDLDFCRQAELLNLKMGTLDISAIHGSKGSFGSARWKLDYEKYISKWKS